jgi:hypothetical protein
MKTEYMFRNLGLGLALAATVAWGSSLKANEIDYSNLANTSINFNGTGGFSFSNVANQNIKITGSTTGQSIGLDGEITGNYQIGAISTFGTTSVANVTGTGSLIIYDGANTLTATLTWDDIVQTGTGSTINDNGVVNLSSITYAGTDADLVNLQNALGAVNTLTFSFTPAKTLSSLTTAPASTSFAGSISTVAPSVPDNASTAFLLGLGALGIVLGAVAQRRKAAALVA